MSAHCPGSGVKTYVCVAVLSNAGDQLPKIPLAETVGSGAIVAPAQIKTGMSLGSNIGIVSGLTSIVIKVVSAHGPGAGVNV